MSEPSEPPTLDEADVAAATRVFSALNDEPDIKQHAAHDERLRELLSLARKVVAPNKSDKKERAKKKAALKTAQDWAVLSSAKMRAQKLADLDHKMHNLSYLGERHPPKALASASVVAADDQPALLAAGEQENATTPMDCSKESAAAASAASESRKDGRRDDDDDVDGDIADQDDGDNDTQGNGVQRPLNKRRRVLNRARSCFICHQKYSEVHDFYDQLCDECATLNLEKRGLTADLSRVSEEKPNTRRVALVTGGRVKIGYSVALRLLRMGAITIVQTRFAHDAAKRFAQEDDYETWKERLHIYSVDFRDTPSVFRFTEAIKRDFDRLDILINNAAQTVRKPPGFYRHLLRGEAEALPPSVAPTANNAYNRTQLARVSIDGDGAVAIASTNFNDAAALPLIAQAGAAETAPATGTAPAASTDDATSTAAAAVAHTPGAQPTLLVPRAAVLSQVPLLVGDEKHDETLFPTEKYDEDKQQLDLRSVNSWRLKLGQVSAGEMMECHAINAAAPFILNSELKPLLSADAQADKYIVNVSAMEGQFYRRNKSTAHPHSNMAKASLNMMTRTSAPDYAREHIYMTSVDTGWITDENPVLDHLNRQHPPPLDCVDAAMRILDPVLTGINDPEKRVYNVFLKDYKPTHW
eukprot:m.154635 g.154635  ORF g.154635 m.154635 type:complete len:642 (-) comp17506_c0_seq3:204-2129(-)